MDDDNRYELMSKEGEAGDVLLKVLYKGFVCRRRNPHGHWSVDETVDGTPVPTAFVGKFTDKRALFTSIDFYIARSGDA
jgi:hypothetical protein